MNKGKQKEGVVQNEEIFLYKPYNILTKASTLTTSESGLMQEEINNLEKVLKTLQTPTKTILFLPPNHYKVIL